MASGTIFMPHRFSCYLRLCRRQWALTQREIARLFRLASRQHVSRVERGKRTPSVFMLAAVEIMFDQHWGEIFPEIFREAEKHVIEELTNLRNIVCRDTSSLGQRKCAFATEALDRVTKKNNNTKEYAA